MFDNKLETNTLLHITFDEYINIDSNPIDSNYSYSVDTKTIECQIDSFCPFFGDNACYLPFVNRESVYQQLLENKFELPKPQREVILLNEDYCENAIRKEKDIRRSLRNISLSDSSSDSYSDSDDSSDSSDDEDIQYNRKQYQKIQKKKPISKKLSYKKITSESEKRNLVMKINQQYAATLKSMNDDVVRAYKRWKALERNGQPFEYAKNEWMNLNKKYTSMKRRNAREIFDKVQSINRKMNINSNVYDLHGQGVKCGNLQYILKRIVANEEKKSEDSSDGETESKYVLDIGNEMDGEWHQHAKYLVIAFLKTRKMNFTLDEEKRYITVCV